MHFTCIWLASTHKTHIIPILRSNDVDYPQLIIYNTWQSCFRCTRINIHTIWYIHHCSLKTTCLYLLPHLLFNRRRKKNFWLLLPLISTNGRYEDALTFIHLKCKTNNLISSPFLKSVFFLLDLFNLLLLFNIKREYESDDVTIGLVQQQE